MTQLSRGLQAQPARQPLAPVSSGVRHVHPSQMTSLTSSVQDAAALWRQTDIPVIYRPGGAKSLKVHLPYRADNKSWLQHGKRFKPIWHSVQKCWEVPKAWFDEIVRLCLVRFDRVYVIQPYREQEKCAPACWNAKGFECECSCMGENHGQQNPIGSWRVISETFAVSWKARQLACRLIERAEAKTHGHA